MLNLNEHTKLDFEKLNQFKTIQNLKTDRIIKC